MRSYSIIFLLLWPMSLMAQDCFKNIDISVNNPWRTGIINGTIKAGPRAQITALAFSADNTILASGGYREVLLWNLPASKLEKRIQLNSFHGNVRSLKFLSGNKLLLGCGDPGFSGALHLIDITDNSLIASFFEPKDAVTDLAISANEKYAVAGDATGAVYVYDLEKKILVKQFSNITGEISGIEFGDNDSKLIVSSLSGQLRIWDTSDWSLFFSQDFPDPITGVCGFRKGNQLVMALNGESFSGIKILGIRKNPNRRSVSNERNSFSLGGSRPCGVAADTASRFIVVPCSDGHVEVIFPFNANKNKLFQAHSVPVNVVALTSNKVFFATGDAEGCIKLWDAGVQRLAATLVQPQSLSDGWLIISYHGYYTGSDSRLISWSFDKQDEGRETELFDVEKLSGTTWPKPASEKKNSK
ncbi:MAG: hypothetical protein Q8928_09065 [Bacteroidota bacterium]|nr:hypothetical protein [Bacteroidota bacterium]